LGCLARVGIQESIQPGKGFLVVFAASADVTDPSGEVRNLNQVLSQPGEIRDEPQAHDACLTLVAGKGSRRLFLILSFSHFDL
jgi:hypothetical protein